MKKGRDKDHTSMLTEEIALQTNARRTSALPPRGSCEHQNTISCRISVTRRARWQAESCMNTNSSIGRVEESVNEMRNVGIWDAGYSGNQRSLEAGSHYSHL